MMVSKRLMVSIDFHTFFPYYRSQYICLVLQNILFYVQHKKEAYTGWEWHESE